MATTIHNQSRVPVGLLRNRNFALLWCAYGVSAMGDHISEMAILKTQDALNAGVDITPLNARMTFTFFVPFFLLAPVAGMLADRFPRRLLMILADAARCLIMFGFAGLIAWTQDWGAWGPFMPLLAVGAFAALFSPARSALLPTLIRPEQLVRANGMISGLGFIATMAAAKISGWLADHYVPVVSFRVDAVTFLGSAILLVFLRPPRLHAEVRDGRSLSSSLRDLRAGFRYARCHRHVLELLAIAALVWFCAPLVNSVIPAIVRDVYGGSYQLMSDYRMFVGIGLVVGAIIVSVLGDALRSEIAISWGLLGIGAAIAVFAGSVFLPFAALTLAVIGAVGVVVAGMFALAVMASFNALLQRTVADRYRGRIFGVRDVGTTASLLLATGFLGVPHWSRVDRWVGPILIAVAVMFFAAGLLTIRLRLRRGRHGPALTFAENLNEFVAKFWWRFRRIGPSTVPREGAVIITANHRCPADPLFLCAAAPYRAISFLIAAEYANWPIAGFFVRLAECIPVRRGTQETSATKQALRHLKEGKAMGIFIEGGIPSPHERPEPKDGVAMLALKTGAKVIPAHISGSIYRDGMMAGFLTRHRARVRFGPPVDLSEFGEDRPNRETVRAATRKIYEAIQALAPAEGE